MHVHLPQSPFGQWGGALRGISRKQKDTIQQLFESNGWPWNVEVTDVCETEGIALHVHVTRLAPPFCIQIVLTSELLSLKTKFTFRKMGVNFMSVPSVIFKQWSNLQIFVINQQQCDCVIV